ncbi:MAG TPA: S4 domain-containing protein [Steroidobacteraceae bacterium]|nr:S4 domain-containing protein [Steroidobacteraceae bacterium]
MADRDAPDEDEGAGAEQRLRLDRWLWCARFYKSRSLAAAAVAGGHVHLNGARVKPAHVVRVGDALTLTLGGRDRDLEVSAIPERRGPATEARRCYRESEASLARGARQAEAQRLAALTTPRPDGRPDKKERRALYELARRHGRR